MLTASQRRRLAIGAFTDGAHRACPGVEVRIALSGPIGNGKELVFALRLYGPQLSYAAQSWCVGDLLGDSEVMAVDPEPLFFDRGVRCGEMILERARRAGWAP